MQSVNDLGQRQHPHPRRRQLDRQRQTIQASTDLAHRRDIVIVDSEIGPSMASTVGE